MNPQEQLLQEVISLIQTNAYYETAYLTILYVLLLASIVASTAAAILTALEKGPKWAVVVLAALPAACLTIESSFNFAERISVRSNVLAELQDLKRGIEITNTVTLQGGKEKLAQIDKMIANVAPSMFSTTTDHPRP